jgi:glutamyl-tRNA synthetase/nondiscriminating glutamyl-tRNA synthetase
MRVRFAPSPTGHLHVGNARTALFNWLLARGSGGTFILRIEDTDVERSTRDAEAAIHDDLRWLGLAWDEGPDVGGPKGPYRQSERLTIYREHADRLLASGAAYYCFCSAEQLDLDRQRALQAGQPPKYRGRCRALGAALSAARVARGEAAVVRFRVPPARDVSFSDVVRGQVTFNTAVIGDPVLLRSDGHPAYNFAVVVDDALMRVTHVVRGEDHISNTPRQLLLYEAFGFAPPAFAHLALVLGPDHSPLSKRHGATSVAEFRQRGYLPEAVFNYLALIGWSPGQDAELLPRDELARRFRLEQVGHSSGVFDESKLAWVNRQYLKAAEPARLATLMRPYLERAGWVRRPGTDADPYIESLVPLVSTSVDRLDQVADRLRVVFEYDAAATLARPEAAAEFSSPASRAVAETLAAELENAGRLADRDAFRAVAARVRERTRQKGRALFHPIRVALTGELEGPELDLIVPAIDRGADLPTSAGIVQVLGCRERARAFADRLQAGAAPDARQGGPE